MEQYTLFMQNSGLFHLLSEHLINNLYDYLNANIALISMNTNHFLKSSLMEDFTESYLIKAGLILNLSYFKNSSLNDYFYQKDKLEKYIDYHQKFDFIFKGAFDEIYLCDVCFASSFNEVINNKIKKMMSFSSKIKNRENIHIILITDEISSTYKSYFPDELSNFNLYNCNDLSHGLINTLVNPLNQIEAILSKIKFD
jgi:type II restriction enzyme